MFRHILLPLDFSKSNERALRTAAKLARAGRRTRLTLLHAIETIQGVPEAELRGFYRTLRKRAEAKIKPAAERLSRATGTAVRTEVILGSRVEEIVRSAAADGVDLVVMSSHRVNPRRPGNGLGTISHMVGILARCPVLLVR